MILGCVLLIAAARQEVALCRPKAASAVLSARGSAVVLNFRRLFDGTSDCLNPEFEYLPVGGPVLPETTLLGHR